ncbi:MAG: DUF6880 family protein [Methylocella sp.]
MSQSDAARATCARPRIRHQYQCCVPEFVAAALAATRGPAAVAAIIDKRLAGLDRAKAFVDWEKAKAFTANIAATVATITGELASADHAPDIVAMNVFVVPTNASSCSNLRHPPPGS